MASLPTTMSKGVSGATQTWKSPAVSGVEMEGDSQSLRMAWWGVEGDLEGLDTLWWHPSQRRCPSVLYMLILILGPL